MSSRPEIKEWTVMFYLATDNPLAPGVISHLKAMKNAGYHPQVNVLAQFDPHGANFPVHVFDVNRMEKLKNPNRVNIGFAPNDSYVRNLVADKLWNDKGNKRIKRWVKDSVRYTAPIPSRTMMRDNDPQMSLRLFLDFCRRKYPARHYMLFILGHGLVVAGDVFLFDENGSRRKGKSGPLSLSLKELGKVLDGFSSNIKHEGELELIGFHSCSMSGAEVAFELKDKANHMLAAQGPAYVGVWPYRQILIRLFNDLGRSVFSRDDLETNGLIDKLKTGRDATYRYIREQLSGNGGMELLTEHVVGGRPEEKLVGSVATRLEHVLSDRQLFTVFPPAQPTPHEVSRLINILKNNTPKKPRMNEEYVKWLNRQLLMGGLTAKARTGYTKANIKNLLVSIFKYCYFNSLDFQLAGYSCDLTLCNLRKVGEIEKPVHELVKAMTEGLSAESEEKDPVMRDLLLLAHWESQSFYEEKYTDLYDFCFCLKRKCRTSKHFNKIALACDAVMEKLKRGSNDDDDGVIVRSESCGPAYQYSHGLSVYFPWAEPVTNDTWRRQYRDFKFSRATGWRRFLKLYFKKTMRATQGDEPDSRDRCSFSAGLASDLLELLEDMSTAAVFNDDGQLTKVGSKDPLGSGKSGSLDPTGSDCDCGSIKNYPTISHARHKNPRRFKGHRATTNMYESFVRYFDPRKP
jgi:cysteine peptidase C11 family protein